jgi:hypothetical protein
MKTSTVIRSPVLHSSSTELCNPRLEPKGGIIGRPNAGPTILVPKGWSGINHVKRQARSAVARPKAAASVRRLSGHSSLTDYASSVTRGYSGANHPC